LHEGEVGGLVTHENSPSVNTGLAKDIPEVGSVANQAAAGGKRALIVHGGQRMAGRQRHELLAPVGEERIGDNKERTSPLLIEAREGRIDLAFAPGVDDMVSLPFWSRPALPGRANNRLMQRNTAGASESPPSILSPQRIAHQRLLPVQDSRTPHEFQTLPLFCCNIPAEFFP
jgi:hypothetical protein